MWIRTPSIYIYKEEGEGEEGEEGRRVGEEKGGVEGAARGEGTKSGGCSKRGGNVGKQ